MSDFESYESRREAYAAERVHIHLSKKKNSFVLNLNQPAAHVWVDLDSDVFGILDLTVDMTSLIIFNKINIPEDSILVIRNFTGDPLVSSPQWMDIASISKRIIFEEDDGSYLKSRIIYGNGLCGIEPTREFWYPAPEVSTYGAALSFSALGVGFIRKRKKRRARSLIPSGVPA